MCDKGAIKQNEIKTKCKNRDRKINRKEKKQKITKNEITKTWHINQ